MSLQTDQIHDSAEFLADLTPQNSNAVECKYTLKFSHSFLNSNSPGTGLPKTKVVYQNFPDSITHNRRL